MNAFYGVINESRKGLLILWDYKFNLLIEWVGIVFIFVGIMFFVGQGQITDTQVASTVLGFIVTFYALNAISDMSFNLMEEAQTGTLEQLYMSPSPSQLMVLGRSLASMVSATVQVLFTTVIIFVLFQLQLPLTWEMLPVLLITIVGLLGFGYVVGGLTLVFKHVGPLANIMQNALLIANGTFLPVSLMPAWLGTTVMFFPSTLGIILLRRVVLDGDSLAMLRADGSLLWLVFHSGVVFVLGWVIYAFCENIARKQGSLGQY